MTKIEVKVDSADTQTIEVAKMFIMQVLDAAGINAVAENIDPSFGPSLLDSQKIVRDIKKSQLPFHVVFDSPSAKENLLTGNLKYLQEDWAKKQQKKIEDKPRIIRP